VFSRRQVVSLGCWGVFVVGWTVLAVISFANDAWVAGAFKLVTAILGVAVIGVTTTKALRA
jgi:hypothetical protein